MDHSIDHSWGTSYCPLPYNFTLYLDGLYLGYWKYGFALKIGKSLDFRVNSHLLGSKSILGAKPINEKRFYSLHTIGIHGKAGCDETEFEK